MCICAEGVSADSSQENPPVPPTPGTKSSPQPWLSSVTCQVRTQTNSDPCCSFSDALAIDKERLSPAVCEIKTTAVSRKCEQYLDKGTTAMRSRFQQVFLTFRPPRVTFYMCDVLGVDSEAQHLHRQLICG